MAFREFEKNKREKVRVTPNVYEGYNLIDIRVYAKNKDGEIVPTPKGVSLNVDTIPELIDALKWSLGQPCTATPDSQERKLDPAEASKLAATAWQVLRDHGSAVHWDSAAKIVLSKISGFSEWDLHYVLATREDLFERVGTASFRARKNAKPA